MSVRKKFILKATTYDRKGNVIAVGFNSYIKTHPKQSTMAAKVGMNEKQTLHAEIAAIIRSKRHVIHKIKVERYDSCGNPKMAKPCPVCELAIKEAGIKFVEYTV